jgi:hypothetical protein
MERATSGGSRWGFRIWNQRVEENTGIYIGLGFRNFSEFLNFGIILIPRIKIIPKNLELPFKPRKIARSSEKSPEKSWRHWEG